MTGKTSMLENYGARTPASHRAPDIIRGGWGNFGKTRAGHSDATVHRAGPSAAEMSTQTIRVACEEIPRHLRA
ncbi:hypothetical protein [Nocardia sp. R6R-6]|uniref:hypothetical protein n=1 Tax=Nocardia sp. R6R-6 TaxID=3459303 RepID=UPI00403D75B1